jgi:hypothetical protein
MDMEDERTVRKLPEGEAGKPTLRRSVRYQGTDASKSVPSVMAFASFCGSVFFGSNMTVTCSFVTSAFMLL